jgi:hypothetical protein
MLVPFLIHPASPLSERHAEYRTAPTVISEVVDLNMNTSAARSAANPADVLGCRPGRGWPVALATSADPNGAQPG